MVIHKVVEKMSKTWPETGFLTGRTALVTGGARRLGRHLALALARQGADIVLHYRASGFEASATVSEIEKLGSRVISLQSDLDDTFMAEDLLHRASDIMEKPVDILVNNAAVFGPGDALKTDSEEWDLYHRVNVRAPFLMARAMVSILGDGVEADIINMNDFRALRPCSDNFSYTMSKWALHGLTRNLALALAPDVRVNELALGAVMPPNPGSGGYNHTTREDIPIRRFVSPDEVCTALLFLLSNPAFTGETLNLDGGQNLR